MALCFPFEIIGISSLVLLLHLLTVSSSSVIVDAPFGKIRGEIVPVASDNQSYVAFRNIPYAKPPVGDLRFAKPEPHPKIDGVFDGTDRKEISCLQPGLGLNGGERGSEDCLILNIVSKSISTYGSLKKVMVFIHGGNFVIGAAHLYEMVSFSVNHDIIGVTINYRLGVMGFFSTGNEASPGNYGLWDQVMALQWVKDNIKAFGGDPDDVTVCGQSAGASSASYLSLSTVTKGLFSKACYQSGTATSFYSQAIDVQKHALMLATRVECWEGDITETLDLQQSNDLLKCLRRVEPYTLTLYMPDLLEEPMFVPTVDGDFVPNKPNLLLKNESYLESVGFYDRSYFVTIVNDEICHLKVYNEMVAETILQSEETTNQEKKETLAQRKDHLQDMHVRSRWSFSEMPSGRYESILNFYSRRYVEDEAYLQIMNDLTFLIPSYDILNTASTGLKQKSWFLYFDHFPSFMKGECRGTTHGADQLYWLDLRVEDLGQALTATGMKGTMDSEDFQLKYLYSSVLAEFVKTGNPGLALKDILPNGWPEYNATSSFYLNFNLEPTVRSNLGWEHRDLWLKTVPNWEQEHKDLNTK